MFDSITGSKYNYEFLASSDSVWVVMEVELIAGKLAGYVCAVKGALFWLY